MTTEATFQEALGELRAALARAQRNAIYQETIEAQPEVLARFGPVFAHPQVTDCEESEVKAFLRMENNRHWTGLHRMGGLICADMPALHHALETLVDEGQPLEERLTRAVASVRGLGKGIATAILLVVYPRKYGVWNNTSEGGLRQLGAWPSFDRGASFGQRYARVNELLVRLAGELDIDLWALDALLWFAQQEEEDHGVFPPVEPTTVAAQAFGLERHLHEFLRDNWAHTELGEAWDLHGDEEDPDAGYEYPTDVGRIDLLARHKSEPAWLVIELKRGQTSDATVGQLLRYMGWVRHHVAEEGDDVRGLIIAREPDKSLLYALETTQNVTLRPYQVAFGLLPPSTLGSLE